MKKLFIILGAIIVFLVAASVGALKAGSMAYASRAPTTQQKEPKQSKPKADSSSKEEIVQKQIIQKQVLQALPENKQVEIRVTTSGTAGDATIQVHSTSPEKAQYIADLLRRIYPTCTITIVL